GGGSKDWYPIIKPANITAPHVENTTPPDGAVNVSVTPQISITFSNKMNRTATESALSMSGGLNLMNFAWSNGDLTVAFVPTNTLSSTTTYTITVFIAAKDVLENHLENNYQFSFTTKDIIPPTIILTVPSHNSVNIALNENIVITFSESMNTSTVAFSCSPNTGGVWIPFWSNKNSVVTYSHLSNFGSLTTYTFRITGGQDLGGNNLVGGSKPNPWTFTTVDVVGPEITTTTPTNGTKGVLLIANVVVTFSEQMNTTSVNYTCTPDPGGWGTTWTNSDKTVTYTHNPFTTQTMYTFHITQGKDTADNPLNPSLPNPWSFTTKDTIPPKIIVTSPSNGSVNIPITAKIIVTFNEEMDNTTVGYVCNPNPGGWSVTWTGGNTVATFSHNSFIENTKYTFQITSGKDTSGNDLVNGSVPNPWSFTTIDFTPPKISATMPVNGTIGITLNANVVVTFSEAMDTNSIAFTCTPNPGGWAAIWSGGNSIVTYTHDLFTSFTNYTFHITAAKDLAGNDLIAGTIPNPWPFKTKDALSPSIISTFPQNGSANVATTSNIVVIFSEKIDISTVSFICSPNPAGWTEVWSMGDTVVTYMHNPFERYVNYTFQISSAMDLNGNNLVAGEVPNPWSFITIDNIPPVIQSSPIETTIEDKQYIYNMEAFDSNNDILTYQLTSNPSGMTINSSTGSISWVPTNEQVGANPVIAMVADGNGGIDTQSFIITVLNANDAPNITSTPIQTATEDMKYYYDVEAYDIDAYDELTYILITYPIGMIMDSSTGVTTWVPSNEQVGENYATVKVTDKYDGVATQPFTIIVTNVNDPPSITSAAVTAAVEDTPYIYDVQVVDIDPTEDVLTFSLKTNPIDMKIDSATGEISWNPTNDQVGLNNVVVMVSDGNGGSDTQSFSIDVKNVNDPPTIISTPIIIALEDEQYIYDVEAKDIDIGDMLVYGLDTNPVGMTIDTSAGIITWKPTNDDVGVTPIVAKVVDGGGAKALQPFTITVENVNDPPSITSTPVTTATVEAEYLYDLEATDIDPTNDVLTFSLTTYPTGMKIDTSTGAITWTPTEEQVGENAVVVVVLDGNDGTTTQSFTITVDPTEPNVDDEETEKDSVEQLVLFNILMFIIIIVLFVLLFVLLFMFVLKPKRGKLSKVEAAEEGGGAKPEERQAFPEKSPEPQPPQALPSEEVPLLVKAPEPMPPPIPAPLSVVPKLKPKPQAPPPKLKPKSEPAMPKIKSKPDAPIPKIKPKTQTPMNRIKIKSAKLP
ncbi:MAG: Ig-like domain-containing protein, partial [Thermoplasmata archaeon]|nr:Ig-like domain-containing protein [Thermoplasmata archaeon]